MAYLGAKVLILFLAATVLAGMTFSGHGSSVATASTLKLQPADGSVLIGVFEPRDRVGNLSFERTIGRRVALFNSFQAWGGSDSMFNREWARLVGELDANGQVLMITWEPWRPGDGIDQPNYRLKTIIDGKHDEYMKRWFRKVRDLRKPIFVRFAHEMNGDWYPWGTHINEPREYIAAWRHVVNLSRNVGADNITWVWAPSEYMNNHRLAKLYPGREYVDWIGLSGYNWVGPKRAWWGWRSAKRIFGPALAQVKKYKKPIMIAEIGTTENPRVGAPARKTKAAWIARTYTYLKKADPQVSLVVYQNARASKTHDWRITTSRANKAAIKRALSDPRFFGLFQTR